MPSAAAYTSKLRSLASARNVKVQYPGGVSETHRPDRTMMCTDYTATAVDPLKQVVSTIVGPESIQSATSVAVDSNHNVFILDTFQRCVFKLDGQTGAFSVYAGQPGTTGVRGDGGLAIQALFVNPVSIAVNQSGDLFICDKGRNRIRRVIHGSTIIETYAGSGAQGYSGDGGLAVSCSLNNPEGVSVDPHGNVLIADTGNHVIRRVSVTDRIIATVAGNGLGGLTGDCNTATIAELYKPTFAIADSSGAIYISDTGNSLVRVVNQLGVISTLAGETSVGLPIPVGIPGYAGDGGFSVSGSSVSGTTGLALDTYGNLFIADTGNNVIRKINAITKRISTYAGTGVKTYGGDGSVLSIASFNAPNSLSIGPDGTWYIADTGNVRIRAASPGTVTVYSPPWFSAIAYRVLRSKYDPATRSLLTYCECPNFATYEPTYEDIPPNKCNGFVFLNGGTSNDFYTLSNDTFGGSAPLPSNWRDPTPGESPPPFGQNPALRFGRNDFYAGSATDYRG